MEDRYELGDLATEGWDWQWGWRGDIREVSLRPASSCLQDLCSPLCLQTSGTLFMAKRGKVTAYQLGS